MAGGELGPRKRRKPMKLRNIDAESFSKVICIWEFSESIRSHFSYREIQGFTNVYGQIHRRKQKQAAHLILLRQIAQIYPEPATHEAFGVSASAESKAQSDTAANDWKRKHCAICVAALWVPQALTCRTSSFHPAGHENLLPGGRLASSAATLAGWRHMIRRRDEMRSTL